MALKQLREYMFFNNPKAYGYTDIAEDLPGAAKPIGHMLHNVLPSAAIISQDPAERKAQIAAAVERIKNTKKSGKELYVEMLDKAYTMGKSSLIGGLIFSALFGKMGLRLPRAAGRWRAPIELGNIKGLFGGGKNLKTQKYLRKKLLVSLATDSLSGAGFGAATGALVPYIANKTDISHKSMEDARKIMEEQPYLTSLPGVELLQAIDNRKSYKIDPSLNIAKNTALGGGLGYVTGAAGSMLPTLATGALSILSRGKLGPKGGVMNPSFVRQAGKSLKQNEHING
jgi:hypothetical protein